MKNLNMAKDYTKYDLFHYDDVIGIRIFSIFRLL